MIPGGSSVPVVPGDAMMEANMDYDSIQKAGSLLGSGAVVIMDETTCMVRMAADFAFITQSLAVNAHRAGKVPDGSIALDRIIQGQGNLRTWIVC